MTSRRPSVYGADFDALVAEWQVIENAHDREHPDRGECGGVGACTTMRIAVDLEHRMIDELVLWRRPVRTTGPQ